ncbi:hypothetical protein CPJCM30710_01560 [Clostridium polyendosporum]|uniref:Uncharacterized protein n=1 Tax=Clostridium polyendosporum TaxID=69208 RepID=A0A919RXY0_9CLOT|nr:hypothetical protein [Clostridium polyendosporum]GIM27490.1 hypothetical protein CPJCM30710_01560 [Clostridium polyendosporum]
MSEKRETSLKLKRRKRRKQRIRRLFIITLSLALLFILIRASYINSKCKDLYYATDYYMTSKISNSQKLLRVKTMKLLFSDGKTAIVEVYGMQGKTPHDNKTYKAYFKRNNTADSWKLDKIYDTPTKEFSETSEN